jgi:hypothetical protein
MPKKLPPPPSKAEIVEQLQAQEFDKTIGFAAGLQHSLNLIDATVRQNPHVNTTQREVLSALRNALAGDLRRARGY